MQDIIAIANAFKVQAPIIKAEKYGCGHINDTYRVTDENGKYYILQRINHNIFQNVDALMRNIVGVTAYIAERQNDGEVLKVIETVDAHTYHKSDLGYFRMYSFIYGGVSIETRATSEELKASASGFGRFQKLLDGYPAEELYDTIPDFHNTAKRFIAFREAIANDVAGRLKDVRKEVKWYLDREKYVTVAVDAIREGKLPLRVTHNDTKLNNVLIDCESIRPVAVIDLDTVMKGSIIYDFGDGIRSGANTGAEDERDLSKVHFSLEAFRAYAEGFLGEVGKELTEGEKELMAFGAILMTFECGMRFLTDYLNGDTYFKVHREGHNLDRTRTQMRMVEEMEEALPEMNKIIREYAG